MSKIPTICIGLPVYNGEKFIRKKIESILAQTFSDYELIITDNCSKDNTLKICREFAENDSRIKIISHKNNIGAKRNFYSSLKQSKNEFFVWTAVDDLMESTFLEKNIAQLKNNKNLVGSISKIDYYSNKVKSEFNFIQLNSLTGTYDKKVRFFLTKSSANIIYSIFRKNQLELSLVEESIGTWDSAIILNILKYGDINVLEEKLLEFFDEGISTTNLYNRITQEDKDMGEISSSDSYFLKWCLKHLGSRIILKNLDIFIRLNFSTLIKLFLDYLKRNH